jgi:hypothetical protein
VVAAYKADPLVHDRIAPRLARFIVDGCESCAARAALDGADAAALCRRRPLRAARGQRRLRRGGAQGVVTARVYPRSSTRS